MKYFLAFLRGNSIPKTVNCNIFYVVYFSVDNVNDNAAVGHREKILLSGPSCECGCAYQFL